MSGTLARRSLQWGLVTSLLSFVAVLAGCGGESPTSPAQSSSRSSAASGPVSPLQSVEFTGTLTAMSARTPGATLVVASRTVRTAASTLVRRRGDPVPFDRLAAGQIVEVEGTPQTDGSVLASRITIEDEPDEPDDDEVEFIGTITSLSSKAPGAVLIVSARTVRTNTSTLVRRRGDPVGFDRLAVGQTVEVDGTPLADGSVLAAKITIENEPNAAPVPPVAPAPPLAPLPPAAPAPPDVEVRFEGTLTALSGTASSGTLIVSTRTVQTSAATDFRRNGSGTSHVTFDALRTGQRVEVRGRQRGNDPIVAQRVTILN